MANTDRNPAIRQLREMRSVFDRGWQLLRHRGPSQIQFWFIALMIGIAIAVVSWPPLARLVRGEFISLRNREFVQANVLMGMPDWKIIVVQILPNAISPIIVAGSLLVATAILIESALAFLGLGDPNVMSWGFEVGAGRTVLRRAWWICTFPGIAILLTVLAINLVGEGLNDALNPRLRERSS